MNNYKGALMYGIGIDNGQLKADAAQSQKLFENIGDKAVAEGSRIDGTMKKIGAGMVAFFGVQQFAAWATQIATVRGEFQQLEVAFNVMLGSKEKATKLMGEMVTLAAVTPFQLKDVADGAKQLLAYGTASENITETLTRLGDVAAGLSIPLGDLVYLYGTAQTQGRLYAQDMRQFMGRGIPMADVLSKQLGVAKTAISDMVSEGKIGFPEVEKAFVTMTSAGGQFGGLMEAQSKTITGRISNLKDAVSVMLNNIGKSNEGVINSVISGGSYMVTHYETVGKIIAELVVLFGAYKAAVITYNVVMKEQAAITAMVSASNGILTKGLAAEFLWTERLQVARARLNALYLTNPYVLAAMAVLGLVAAFVLLYDGTTAEQRAQKELNNEFKNAEDAKGKLISKTDELIAKMRDETTTAQGVRKAYDELQKSMPKAFQNLSLEQFQKMTDKEVKIKINTVLDEQEYDNIKAQLAAQQKEVQYQLLQPAAGTGAYYVINVDTKLLDVAKEKVRLLQEKLQRLNEIREQARVDNLPEDERLVYYKNQLALLQQQRTALETLQGTTKNLNKEWGAFDTQSWMNMAGLKALDDKIAIMTSNVTNIKNPEVATGGGNKAYWEGIKNKAQADRDALTQQQIGGTLWNQLSSTITSAEAKLSAWSPSKKKEKAKTPEELAKEAQDIINQIRDNAKEIETATREANLEISQAGVDAMDEGFGRTQAQQELDHQKALLAIDKRAAEMVKRQQESEKLQWEKDGSKGVFKPSTLTEAQLPDAQRDILTGLRNAEDKVNAANSKKVMTELVDKYQDYAAQRKKIEEKFQADITQLQTDPEANKAAIDQAAKERQKALDDVAQSALKEFGLLDLYLGKGSDYIDDRIKLAIPAFKDLAGSTVAQLNLIDTAIQDISIPDEILVALKTAGVDVEELIKQLKLMKKSADDATDTEKWGKVLEFADKVAQSVGHLGSALEETGGALGEIGGILSGLAGSVDNISAIFKKGAKPEEIAAAGIASLADLYSLVANQIQANKDAQDEWNASIAQSAHLMSMYRIEELAYKDENIFSSTADPFAHAMASALQYKQAMVELAGATQALNGGQVQTGTKQVVSGGNIAKGAGAGAGVGGAIGTIFGPAGTLIGAGIGAVIGGIIGGVTTKTVATFKSLSEQYGTIVMDDMTLNPKILADYDKLDEATKKLVDNWEEVKAAAETARKEVEDTFKSLAGEVGKTLSDQLVEAFRNGDLYGAMDDFHTYMTGIIENIIAQMIFAKTMQPWLDQLAKDMNDSFGLPTNGVKADPSKLDYNITDDLAKYEENSKKSYEDYLKYMEAAQSSMEGYEFFAKTRAGTTGAGIATASQESVDVNNGLLTNIQSHTFSMKNDLTMLLSFTMQFLTELKGINQNTKRLESIETNMDGVKKGIDRMNSDGVLMRAR